MSVTLVLEITLTPPSPGIPGEGEKPFSPHGRYDVNRPRCFKSRSATPRKIRLPTRTPAPGRPK
jgi:hypothetical protein